MYQLTWNDIFIIIIHEKQNHIRFSAIVVINIVMFRVKGRRLQELKPNIRSKQFAVILTTVTLLKMLVTDAGKRTGFKCYTRRPLTPTRTGVSLINSWV